MSQHSGPPPTTTDFPLDLVHRWTDWCAMVGVDPSTAWRWEQAGQGPIVTQLGRKAKGVRHRHHLAWLAARERQNEAA
jgi:predicted site-specific integrase-resolvase